MESLAYGFFDLGCDSFVSCFIAKFGRSIVPVVHRMSKHEEIRSTCDDTFGHDDFDVERIRRSRIAQCPVKGCADPLVYVPYRANGTTPVCRRHGIRLHTDTFVYWNGSSAEEQRRARIRNFIGDKRLAHAIALKDGMKVESHRLGFEMSEDALSWNVFTSLRDAGRLKETVEFLTGYAPRQEPILYLWGRRIDDTAAPFLPLLQVREQVERGIRTFVTEPDIMLVMESEMLVLIEAKFGSGNTLADQAPQREGNKPTSPTDLVHRYLDTAPDEKLSLCFDREQIGHRLHSQLFRNLVFAARMSAGRPWHVTNLVSRTQFNRPDSGRYSFRNPEEAVRRYLRADAKSQFTFRTWEDLFKRAIEGNSRLSDLERYMRAKSAHYLPAFDMPA